MNHDKMSLYDMLVVTIITVGVLIMAGCLYADILLMKQVNERIDALENIEIVVEIKSNEVEEDEETEVIEEEPVAYFDVPLNRELQDHIFAECEKHDIDPEVIVAMIERESQFDSSVIGDSGRSFGLMQIQERWHKERMARLGCDDLLDPYQNVTVGIDFLAELIGHGKGVEWALMAYNGGPSYANRLSEKSIVSDYAADVIYCAGRVETRI